MDAARGRDAWGRACEVVAAIYNTAFGRKGPAVDPRALNPYAPGDRKPAKPEPVARVDVEALRWLFVPQAATDTPAQPCSPSPPQ